MFKRILAILAAVCCLAGLGLPVMAAEVECDAIYCFSGTDFGSGEEPLAGICVLSLPTSGTGTVMLGSRVLRPGDILTADQLEMLTFSPLRTEEDQEASMTYLPVYEHYVADPAVMTISIWGKEDKAPVAEDFALETYKNLANAGTLKARDPEGEALTYTVTRQPRRGEVVIREDGSFTYTPKKNKVGTDSFTYTATDPAGNVSREATVTITILKPTAAAMYSDTAGSGCEFEAEWLKHTGIFEGEKLGGNTCFQPEKALTGGEFLTMLIRTLELPTEEALSSAVATEVPEWLKPYVAAAIRSGLTAGLPESFTLEAPVTQGEAAVMLQNALSLTVSANADLEAGESQVPAWALSAVNVLADNGIALEAEAVLTRGTAATLLYQASLLAEDAPGMAILRAQ